MFKRYNFENLLKVLGQPEFIFWELQRLKFDFKFSGKATNVMEKDWDNLLLLDACRYDYFERQNDLPGDLDAVLSHGGQSWEFMEGNFVGEQLHDTVYVTANPHTGKLGDNVFHAVEPLYLNAWSKEHETVLPQDVAEAGIKAQDKYPNKRLIVHFMQPHRPYLGDTAEQLQQEHGISGFNRELAYNNKTREGPSFSTLIERGVISIERTKKAYSETLDIVLAWVADLLNTLSGKSVVSADHGELLGERIIPFGKPKFGHSHEYIRNKTLYQVPWLEIPFEERRRIKADEPIGSESGAPDTVKERLHSLGYK